MNEQRRRSMAIKMCVETEQGRFADDLPNAVAYDVAMNTAKGNAMNPLLSPARIAEENAQLAVTGATGTARRFGFHPAFLDFATMRSYPSRFADGSIASFHVLDGLPDEVVVERLPSGSVVLAKATLICGFERGGFFYTRSAAARACKEWDARLGDSFGIPLQ